MAAMLLERGPPKKRKKKTTERNSETAIIPAPTMMCPPSINPNSTSSIRSATGSNKVPLLLLEDGATKKRKGKTRNKATKAKVKFVAPGHETTPSATKKNNSIIAPASPAMSTRSKATAASSPTMGTRSKVATTNNPAMGSKRKLYC